MKGRNNFVGAILVIALCTFQQGEYKIRTYGLLTRDRKKSSRSLRLVSTSATSTPAALTSPIKALNALQET